MNSHITKQLLQLIVEFQHIRRLTIPQKKVKYLSKKICTDSSLDRATTTIEYVWNAFEEYEPDPHSQFRFVKENAIEERKEGILLRPRLRQSLTQFIVLSLAHVVI